MRYKVSFSSVIWRGIRERRNFQGSEFMDLPVSLISLSFAFFELEKCGLRRLWHIYTMLQGFAFSLFSNLDQSLSKPFLATH
jgi:hypothetical protein